MPTSRIGAWLSFVLALTLWALFGYLVWELYGERAEYVAASTAAQEAELRGQSASRLRASVHDTEVERAALESLLETGILRAVEILETTARQAGATDVSIGEATPMPVGNSTALTSVSIVVNMQGSFSALMRAVSLYETLTVPSTLEQFEMEEVGSAWRATMRVRVYHNTQ
jgi:hypothetical protein